MMKHEDRRKSSIEVLKMVYYVIIGLAIIGALSRTFLIEGSFIGWQVFNEAHLPTTLLLLAFLPTVCRFVHGASIHLDTSVTKRYKSIIDFVGFFMQASFFYIMALALRNPGDFIMAYILMLSVDFVWLVFLKIIKYIEDRDTAKQWMISDVVIIIVYLACYFLYRQIPNVWVVWCVMLVSIIAAYLDYRLNKDFYFPWEESPAINRE